MNPTLCSYTEVLDVSYPDYLRTRDLLNLQNLLSEPAEHDETLFIIIHQAYELWFKQILHEFDLLRTTLSDGDLWLSMKTMRRVLTILKVLVHQVDILETMTPLSFLQFRSFLADASGFQSAQFRELEIICGVHTPSALKVHVEGSPERAALERRLQEKTLQEALCAFLRTRGYETPDPIRHDRSGLIYDTSPAFQDILVDVMRTQPDIALLCELFVDFDEGLQEWRYRHVKMVERTIGTKAGTGGSSGAGYLYKTLNRPVFPDLWAIRNRF